MSNESIVRLFLQNDILLRPEEFRDLGNSDHMNFLEEKIREKNAAEAEKRARRFKTEIKSRSTIPSNHIKSKQPEESTVIEISVLDEMKENDKKRIKVMDIVSVYNKKYNEIREILSEKIKSISINKTESSNYNISVIGIISQKTDNGFKIEDETGSLNVIYSGNCIENDDVVAVSGRIKNNSLFAENVILPDIPITNFQKTLPVKISFDFRKSESVRIDDKEFHVNISSFFSLRKEKDEMKILFYRTKNQPSEKQLVNFLRKRCINAENNITPHFFVINDVPDVFIVSSEGSGFRANYKSVTIISAGLKNEIIFK